MSSLNDYNAAVAAGKTVGHEYAKQQADREQAAMICDHCGALRSIHPVKFEKTPSTGQVYSCALTYDSRDPSQLPFDLRPLNQDDRNEIQKYLSE